MTNVFVLVRLPRLEQPLFAFVGEVDSTAGCVLEVVCANLLPAHQRYGKPIRECPKLFGDVEGKGWAPRTRTMQKTQLEVKTDAFRSSGTFRHEQGVAKAQQSVDRIPWWSSCPGRELKPRV